MNLDDMPLTDAIEWGRSRATARGVPATPRVGAAALVLRGPLLLLGQRQGSHGAGKWSLPGGWQEFGEPVTYTAVREVHEETGLVVAGGAVIGVGDDFMPWDGVHGTTWFIGCKYLGGDPEVREPDKCAQWRWVLIEALDSLDLFEPLRHFILTQPHWLDKLRAALAEVEEPGG